MTDKRLAEVNDGAQMTSREQRCLYWNGGMAAWVERCGAHRRATKQRRIRRRMARDSRRKNRG